MAQAIPIALMAASTLYGGWTQHKAANAQAKVLQENARQDVLGGELDAATIAGQERAATGESIAASAANGVSVGSGSAADLIRQNAIEGEWDALSARYNARSQAYALRQQAKQVKKAGRQALIGSVLTAGAQALSATSKASNLSRENTAVAAYRSAQITSRYPGGLQFPTPASLGGGYEF